LENRLVDLLKFVQVIQEAAQKQSTDYLIDQLSELRRRIRAFESILHDERARHRHVVRALQEEAFRATTDADLARKQSQDLQEQTDELRWRNALLHEENEDLWKVNADLRVELATATWINQRLEASSQMDKRLVPEHAFCPECQKPTMDYRQGAYKCLNCDHEGLQALGPLFTPAKTGRACTSRKCGESVKELIAARRARCYRQEQGAGGMPAADDRGPFTGRQTHGGVAAGRAPGHAEGGRGGADRPADGCERSRSP
jgi:hypothetical protein